jgi:Mg-chelatase subunit ChlD
MKPLRRTRSRAPHADKLKARALSKRSKSLRLSLSGQACEKRLDFTTDHDAVVAAVNDLEVGGGADAPESIYSALMRAIQTEGFTSSWRPEAAKAILLIGDGPAHDPEPNTNYTLADLKAAAEAAGVRVFTIAAIHGIPTWDDETIASFADIAAETGGVALQTTHAEETADQLGAVIGLLTAESICPPPSPNGPPPSPNGPPPSPNGP